MHNLISKEELIKNSKEKEVYKKFNYNSKTFSKNNLHLFDDLFTSKEQS